MEKATNRIKKIMNGKAHGYGKRGKGRKSSTHRYSIKTNTCEKSTGYWKCIRNWDQQLKTILYVHRQTAVSKPHGNHKPKIYNKDTHKKSNPNTTLNRDIKPQENKKGR